MTRVPNWVVFLAFLIPVAAVYVAVCVVFSRTMFRLIEWVSRRRARDAGPRRRP